VKPVIIIAIAIVFLFSSASIYAQSQYDIPAWVKGIAGFWAEDKITDSEFGEGLSFLIDNNIIKVPKIQELQNKIAQLEDENEELRKIKGIPRPEPTLEPEPQISITVSTDQDSYVNGDVISVKGLVRNYSSDAVTLVVSNPQGDTVTLDQLTPRTSGLFTTTFPIGPTFDSSGTYKITVNHKGIVETTTFEFTRTIPFIISIVGDDSCKTKTNQSLELLKNKAKNVYEIVTFHIGVIECVDEGSGMRAYDTPPRFLAGKATVDAGTIWYAGFIAHESCHSYLYSNYLKENPQSNSVPSDIWTGENAEAECLDFQYDALVLIGASQFTLDYVENMIESKYWEIPYEDRW